VTRPIRSGNIPESTTSLNARSTIFFLFWFAIVTFFLLAHVFLRFTIRDLKIETVRLQEQTEKMRAMEKNLVWEIGKLKQGDRLHEYASAELGLVNVDPASIERLRVPARLIAKYSTGGKNTGYEEMRWAEAKYPGGIRDEIGSLLKINRELNAREQTLDAVWKKVKRQNRRRIKK